MASFALSTRGRYFWMVVISMIISVVSAKSVKAPSLLAINLSWMSACVAAVPYEERK